MPLISVIIPTYNHAHYLGEAIESALDQPGMATEVLVVDDGSTDDPAAVAARFPDVRLVSQANGGLAAARNTGWRNSGGAFLVFLDADDRILPGALAANLQPMEKHPRCAFGYGRYRFMGPDGTLRREAAFGNIGIDPFNTFLRGNAVGMHATVMYRRQAFEESGGFDPTLRACEDYDLYLRLARRHPVACEPTLIADYRIHDGNMSRNNPFMLDWALTALRRQKEAARQDPLHWSAYRQGVRNWKRYYAGQQLARACNSPDVGSARDLVRMAWRAPRELASLTAKSLTRCRPGLSARRV
jgi:glycosyltransferase involved in cell wall biosynthesis